MSQEEFEATKATLRTLRDRTTKQDIREQLTSIDEALSNRDAWEDEPERRLTEIRRQLAEMDGQIEPELEDELRAAQEHLQAYQIRHFNEE